MKLPENIWQLKGKIQNGPNVMVLGGTHGDELAGIEIVKKLLTEFKLNDQPSGVYETAEIVGNLFIGFGNPAAIKKQTRAASGLRDLNRSFVTAELAAASQADDTLDLQRARELAPLLKEMDFLFDIHATSNPAPPIVCLNNYSKDYQQYLSLLPIDRLLLDPEKIISQEFDLPEPGTTDYFVFAYGGSDWSIKKYGQRQALALCYETGHESDLSKLDQIFLAVVRLIAATGVIADQDRAVVRAAYEDFTPLTKQAKYKLTICFKARYDGFQYAENMDQGWQTVTKGQLLGHYNNGEAEHVVSAGMLLFPLAVKKVVKGKALYWLAEKLLK